MFSYAQENLDDDIIQKEILERQLEDETEEENYKRNDPIRKFQINYDDSIILTPEFPTLPQISGRFAGSLP